MINTDKIVIVGGGSAGWMSAAAMVRAFPEKDITVIESPDFPTVGVGESTLGHLGMWAKWLGIKDEDFMPATDATYKLSIKFTDFYKKDHGSFHYPFGIPLMNGTHFGWQDWQIKKTLFPETPESDFAETFFPITNLVNQNKISFNQSGKLDNFSFHRAHAFHFDATKFGQWLKNNYCFPRGVKIIQDSVERVITSDIGVEELILTNGDSISADLFIDCTGFKALLLEGALQEPFEDYAHMLPNNSAWATRIPYTDKDKEMEPYTNCTAIGNGWVWNIPSWERIGTGYVFSDKHISNEDALQEFKEYLKSDKMTINDPNRDVDAFEYKLIKFKTGIHKRTFVKNVVAIGLAAGFIEPLESNGLYTTHEFLDKLIRTIKRGVVTQWDRDAYNTATKSQYVSFAEFVASHYALSNRNDTKYWQDISEKSFQPKIMELEPYEEWGFNKLVEINLKGQSADLQNLGYTGLVCISSGMNYFPLSGQTLSLFEIFNGSQVLEKYYKEFDMWEERKKRWQEEADASPTMYEYLKNNIFNQQ